MMPTTDSSQNTSGSPYGSAGGRDDPVETVEFYKRKISALEETLNRREEDRKAKKR